MNCALEDLRVVELGQKISGSYCTKLLADLGADVIKIEPPDEGDPLRKKGFFPNDTPDTTQGALFRYLNTNKRSISLDLTDTSGQNMLLESITEADIFVQSLGPGILESMNIGPERLRQVNPKLAFIRISDFGQEGPYAQRPATDLIVQSLSGWVYNHKMVGQKWSQVGGNISEFTTAAYAAAAALTAYKTAAESGDFAIVDVSKQECLMTATGVEWLHHETLSALGWGSPAERYFPFPGVVRSSDGLVSINALTAQHFADICYLIGVPDYIPKQMEMVYGGPDFESFFRDIEPWLMERTVDEVVEACQAVRIPAVPISDGRKLLNLSQLTARGFFIKDPEGDFEQPSFPYRLALTPASLRHRAPRPGEHNSDIKNKPWQAREERRQLTKTRDELPFAGLMVLDLGTFWAGPCVGCYLGAYGADVIKVESIQRPDGFRFTCAYPEEGSDWFERSGVFQSTNLNKREITLNLYHQDGKRIFEQLVKKAGVIIENFSPRVLGNLGFDTRRLNELNPHLIILRMPGFGLEGPWQEYVSFAVPLEQISGMSWITGHPDGPPMNLGGYADPMVGMHALVALQAALFHRAHTGEGQLIEVAQLEVGVCMTAEQSIAYSITGKTLGRIGNRSATMAPQGLYQCLEDEYLAISIRTDDDWQKFVSLMESPDWAHSTQFMSMEGRRAGHDALDRLIANWCARQHADSVADSLTNLGVPATKVLTAQNMVHEPNLVSRGFFQEMVHPKSGPKRYPRWPWLQSPGSMGTHRFVAPTMGQHNHQILQEELGLSDDEIKELENTQVIGTVPKGLG